MEKQNIGKRAIERAIRKYVVSNDDAISTRAFYEAKTNFLLFYESENKFIRSMVNSLLKNEDVYVRARAAVISYKIVSEHFLEALVAALGDQEKLVRRFAAMSLDNFASNRTLPEDFRFSSTIGLVIAAGDHDLAIRMDAIRSLIGLDSDMVKSAIDRVLAKYGTVDAPESES